MSWRAPFIIQALLAFLLASFCIFLPTSPRWLVLKGKHAQALKEIDRLNITRVEAEKDILNAQHETTDAVSTVEGFFMMFKRNYRARTMLALFVLGMVQLCGIDGVLYVSVLSHSFYPFCFPLRKKASSLM
jgi:MFS family permease